MCGLGTTMSEASALKMVDSTRSEENILGHSYLPFDKAFGESEEGIKYIVSDHMVQLVVLTQVELMTKRAISKKGLIDSSPNLTP